MNNKNNKNNKNNTSKIYVVKKPFKSMGIFHPRGTILDDNMNIKRLKCKIHEGKIIPINRKQDVQTWTSYFKDKYNIDLIKNLESYMSKGSKKAGEPQAKATPPPTLAKKTKRTKRIKPLTKGK